LSYITRRHTEISMKFDHVNMNCHVTWNVFQYLHSETNKDYD